MEANALIAPLPITLTPLVPALPAIIPPTIAQAAFKMELLSHAPPVTLAFGSIPLIYGAMPVHPPALPVPV